MNDKELVAAQAVERVESGMLVGLGTGSTANYFIDALARRHREGLDVRAVSSSWVSALKAQQAGLPLVAVEQVARLDLYVDGADEVAPDLTLLKGRGYDLVREKLLAKAADTFIVLVDDSKAVDRIGARFPIPVEVMPFAWQMVQAGLQALGAKAGLRQNAAGDGFAITSYGGLVLDSVFDREWDGERLARVLNALPGVLEHGVFFDLADVVLIGAGGRVEQRHAERV